MKRAESPISMGFSTLNLFNHNEPLSFNSSSKLITFSIAYLKLCHFTFQNSPSKQCEAIPSGVLIWESNQCEDVLFNLDIKMNYYNKCSVAPPVRLNMTT